MSNWPMGNRVYPKVMFRIGFRNQPKRSNHKVKNSVVVTANPSYSVGNKLDMFPMGFSSPQHQLLNFLDLSTRPSL